VKRKLGDIIDDFDFVVTVALFLYTVFILLVVVTGLVLLLKVLSTF
jgi:hypothetical protein